MSSDPLIPLVKRDDDPFERALLRAGQRERAPRGADRRLLAALGVGGGGALSAVAAKYGPKLGLNAPRHLLATIAVSVAAVAAGAWVTSFSGTADNPPANVAPSPPLVIAPSESPAEVDAPRTAIPEARVEDLPSSPSVAKQASKPAPSASASTSNAAGTGDLAREVELVQAARGALARGDAAEALRTLDTHAREFPNGTLAPESRVLRIETLMRAGGPENTTRANALGDAFLAEHASGPQARRVRAVLGRDH